MKAWRLVLCCSGVGTAVSDRFQVKKNSQKVEEEANDGTGDETGGDCDDLCWSCTVSRSSMLLPYSSVATSSCRFEKADDVVPLPLPRIRKMKNAIKDEQRFSIATR